MIFGLMVMVIVLSSGCVEKPIEKIIGLPLVDSERIQDKIKVLEEESISSEVINLFPPFCERWRKSLIV